jgi:hypothetical protein
LVTQGHFLESQFSQFIFYYLKGTRTRDFRPQIIFANNFLLALTHFVSGFECIFSRIVPESVEHMAKSSLNPSYSKVAVKKCIVHLIYAKIASPLITC